MKAPIHQPKKMMSGKPQEGGAIRLFPAEACIGIAEGIETALAASELFGLPVWSCVSASGVASFVPPASVNRVIIFADNDQNLTGQNAAYKAALRLGEAKIPAEVEIPVFVGDWLDVLLDNRRVARAA